MINLEEIARKLDKILNGIDPEIPTGLSSPVTDNYFFMVYSEGLYLSTIADMRAGTRKNFIPVIVGAYGGENNPVEGLGEQDRNALIQVLFPVRFKEQMYELENYIAKCFVGRLLTVGNQKCVCNTSPAQYGELQDFSFVEFNKWVETNYKMPLDKTETYMSMTMNLYLSTAEGVGSEGGFIFGNSYSVELKVYTDDNFTTYYTESSPTFIQANPTASLSPASQQILGDTYARGMPQSAAYSRQITLYVKDEDFYGCLIDAYINRTYQNYILGIKENYGLTVSGFDISESTEKLYYISDLIINVNKGQLMTIVLTLADYLEDAPSEE